MHKKPLSILRLIFIFEISIFQVYAQAEKHLVNPWQQNQGKHELKMDLQKNLLYLLQWKHLKNTEKDLVP